MGYLFLKNVIDKILSCLLIIVFIPIYLIIGVLVYLTMGKPIFFSQSRAGKNGNKFNIYKFRTMVPLTQGMIGDRERITSVGRILRKLSLDELPQLFNIFLGQMSFIGPRPLYDEYIPYYSDIEKKRLNVKPGMTGYAEIRGRHEYSWDQQLIDDVYYVDNVSLKLDLRIMVFTVYNLLFVQKVSFSGGKKEGRLDTHRKKLN